MGMKNGSIRGVRVREKVRESRKVRFKRAPVKRG
jgi:hypothetical protein